MDGQYQLNNNATIAKLSGRELCNEFRKVKLNQASIDDTGTWSSFDAAMEYAKIYNCDGLIAVWFSNHLISGFIHCTFFQNAIFPIQLSVRSYAIYIKIKLIEGKYVDFEFSVPAESIKKDENSNAYNLPIKLDGHVLTHNSNLT